MGGSVGAAGLAGAAAFAGWAVRGKSSRIFGESVWRGPRNRRAVALTFDDGPSESTSELIRILADYRAKATFFMCGMHVRRLPSVAREVLQAGHEIGNHTDTHASLWLRSASFIRDEVHLAQCAIVEHTGIQPRFFRAPFGVRWPGVGSVQEELGLTGAMWSTIGRDWTLDGNAVEARLSRGLVNGAVFCLHDGRARDVRPDIRATIHAVRSFLPKLQDKGFEMLTLSELMGR